MLFWTRVQLLERIEYFQYSFLLEENFLFVFSVLVFIFYYSSHALKSQQDKDSWKSRNYTNNIQSLTNMSCFFFPVQQLFSFLFLFSFHLNRNIFLFDIILSDDVYVCCNFRIFMAETTSIIILLSYINKNNLSDIQATAAYSK